MNRKLQNIIYANNDGYEKVPKEVTCDLQTKVLKVFKALKKYFKN